MQPRLAALFSLFVILFAAWGLLSTLGWPLKTAFYPRAIGLPLLALAAAEFILTMRGAPESTSSGAMDIEFSSGVSAPVALRRTLGIFAWIGGFLAAIVLLGFPIAVPLFVFAYLRAQAREGWLTTLILVAIAWFGFTAVFVRLLHLPFLEGLLFRLIR
jgi:hypothetical protein